MRILAGLARVPTFHNAVFELNPEVLKKLLSCANRSSWGGQEIEAQLACLSILSQPLPEHVGLPDSASAFFQTLLEGVVACPNLFRLRALHEVTSSQSASILDLVTPEVIKQFASTCNRILRDNADHMRGLLCLCIYAATTKETPRSPLKSSISCSGAIRSSHVVKEWQDSTRKFFVGRKATRTTSLTVLRLLQFCSEDRAVSDQEALEGVELCTIVIEAIEPTILDQWAKENDALLKKLEVRLNSGKMGREVQIAVLNVYISLVCLDTWPSSVPVALQAVIPDLSTDPWPFTVFSARKVKVLSSVLDSIWRPSERLDKCFVLVDAFLYFAIDRCQPGRPLNPQLFIDMNFASIAIGILRQKITNGVALPTQIIEFTITQGIPQWWNVDCFGLGACKMASDDCSGSQCCHYEAEKLRLRLLSSISSLVIEAALNTSSCPVHRRIPPATISSLLQQLGKPSLAGSSLHCSNEGGLHGRTSRWSAKSFVSVDRGRHNWRQTLAIELQTVALDSHELIIGHVNSIYHDLEERCNTMELPLREALEEGEALRKELNSINAELTATSRQKIALEEDLQQARETVAAETEEKTVLHRCFDEAVERENLLKQALADCEKTLTDTVAEAAHELKAAEQSANVAVNAMEAEHLAKLEQLDREHTVGNEKILKLEMENEWIRDHVEILHEDLQRARTREVELERRLKHQAETISDIQQQEIESEQCLYKKSTLLVNAITDAQSLTARLASKSQEVVTLLDQQRKCETECQRLLYDLKQANAFKERIFATINHVSPANGPPITFSVSMTNVLPALNEKASMLTLDEECNETEEL